MKQCKILVTDKTIPYLEDAVNSWLVEIDSRNIKIQETFVSNACITIFYEVENEEEVKRIKERFKVK